MHPIIPFLRSELKKAANPAKAPAMQAYMKTAQPFYGVTSPVRKQILRVARKKFPITNFEEYKSVVWELWSGKYREEMYCALDLAGVYKKFRTDVAMPLYERMLKGATNWDLVDEIAGHLICKLVLNNRKHEAKLKKWARSKNFWLRRTSLLAHLFHREQTNTKLLEGTIVLLIDEKEFFIRKAIGWVLRQYAYTNPKWVKNFVRKYEGRLSGLSKPEAMKHL